MVMNYLILEDEVLETSNCEYLAYVFTVSFFIMFIIITRVIIERYKTYKKGVIY